MIDVLQHEVLFSNQVTGQFWCCLESVSMTLDGDVGARYFNDIVENEVQCRYMYFSTK